MATQDALLIINCDNADASARREAQANSLTVHGAADCLLAALANYTRLAAVTDDDGGNSGKGGQEAPALSVMAHMQRLSLLCNAASTSGRTSDDESIHKCVEDWVKWLLDIESQPIVLASKVALCLPPLQACWRGSCALDSSLTDRIEEAIRSFFVCAARRCVTEWTTHGTPLRTLLPPLALLTTYARFRWAWCRFIELRHIGGGGHLGAAQSSLVLLQSAEAMPGKTDRDTDFLAITEEVESCHAEKLAREVLLHSWKTIDWRLDSAVPVVKEVAPLVWCLFLRCRSYALHSYSQNRSSSDFFAHEASARLIAQVLQCTIDGVRVCLEKSAAGMHAARAKQICACDIPCLVLLTRLWFSWIALASDATVVLLPRLEHSLRQLVTSAVKLRGVAENNMFISSSATAPHRNSREASRTEQENLFVEIAWKVAPLSMSEIASPTAEQPWTAAFDRASEVQAVLEKRTLVAPVP
ncbi:hypothetical protein, conserved [Leishmania tarentolae]|uniref:Uncharacterized protein n=1 Tax=Leishmania tarentolae TaxID=5689 RepID=A0A640KS00_LEITA|nr:hypothetical protein, conserved [Leishmania tarentolae]